MAADIQVLVEVDLDGDGTLTDISERVRLVRGFYGRGRSSFRYETGTCRVDLHSDDGFITPGAIGQHDADTIHGGAVRISTVLGGETRSVFGGVVDDITWAGDTRTATASLVVVDTFARLAGEHITASLPAEYTGERIERILDLAHFPTSVGARDIERGTILCPAVEVDDDALNLLNACALTEQGLFFVDHSGAFYGTLHFLQRAQRAAPAAAFSDTPSGDQLTASRPPELEQDPHLLRNRIEFRLPDGTQIVDDALESQARYGVHTLSANVFSDFDDTQGLASYLLDLYASSFFRVRELEVTPHFEDDAAAAKALELSIGSVLSLDFLPAGASQRLHSINTIDGIAFEVRALDPDSDIVRLRLSYALFPAESSAYWLLNDDASGVLGTTTKLAPPQTQYVGLVRNVPSGRERWVDGESVSAREFSGGVSSQMPSLYTSASDLLVSETRPQSGQAARLSGDSQLDVLVYTGSRFTRQLEASGDVALPPIQATITHTRGSTEWRVVFSEAVDPTSAASVANYSLSFNPPTDADAPLPSSTVFQLTGNVLEISVPEATDGGEIFKVLPNVIQAAGDPTRFVAAATYEVPEPTTPVTATISGFTPKSTQVQVEFSEDVVLVQANNRNAYSLATGTGIVPLPSSAHLVYLPLLPGVHITLHDFARYGQTFQVLANSIQADDTSGRFVEAASVSLPAQPIYVLTSGGAVGDAALTISTPEPLVPASATNPANFMFANLQGSVSGITYTSGTITIALTERLDGGETFGIRSYGIETTDGNFLQEASWTIAEPTDPVLATISATVGSDVVLVDYSEDVVGSDTETAGVFRLNGALFGFGTTYEYNAGLNRTTITASAPLTFGDEIRVIGGLINVDDSSGRTVRGATFNLPVAPEEVAVSIRAQIGQQAFAVVFSQTANAEEALDGDNYLINGRPSGAEVQFVPSSFSSYIAVFSTPLALGDVISIEAGDIHNTDGSATFVGSDTLTASDNVAYSYTVTAEAGTNIITLDSSHSFTRSAFIDNPSHSAGVFSGDIRDGTLSLSGVSGFATGTVAYNFSTNFVEFTLDETLAEGQTITFHDFRFYNFAFGIYLPEFSYTLPAAPEPPAPNRPSITLVGHNRTAVPLLIQWEHSDPDFVQAAVQVRRKTYRTEGRAPNNGLTLEREDWPVRHRYRINNNTRWHHFANAEANDAGDILTTANTVNIGNAWHGGSTPVNIAVRAREATGDWTEWSDDFLVDIQQPTAHSPVASFTSASIAASGELTLNWRYSDGDNSPQASYAVWTIGDGTANGNTWRYEPVSQRAGSLARATPNFTVGSLVRSALINDGWLNTGITTEDYVVFYLMVIDGSGHRSLTSTIRVEKP